MLSNQSPYLSTFFRSQGVDSQPGGIDSSESIPGLHKPFTNTGSLFSPPSKDRNELASNYKKAEESESENKFAKEGHECVRNVRTKSGKIFCGVN
jgi:hypothetical protein